jgi:uncharacterized protein (TIGR03067 family)
MTRTTNLLCLGLMAALVVATGCSKSKPQVADSAVLQGTWNGHEAGNEQGSTSLILTGTKLEYHGSDTNEWYKGTFTLHEDTNPKQFVVAITECADPQYAGKTANAIYQLDNGALTISSYEPGTASFPPGFDAPNTRKIILKAK